MRLTGEQITNRIKEGKKCGRSSFDGYEIVDYYFENVEVGYTSFRGTIFVNVVFDNASLIFCDFSGAEFLNCSVYGNTSFMGSRFYGATFGSCGSCTGFDKARGLFIPQVCPEEGDFIGWKKAYARIPDYTGHTIDILPVIVKLFIPSEAKRSSATSRKCRCDRAKVLDITDIDNTMHFLSAYSGYDHSFNYFVYDEVSVDDFDDNRWNECSTGIHFFITREEAVNY